MVPGLSSRTARCRPCWLVRPSQHVDGSFGSRVARLFRWCRSGYFLPRWSRGRGGRGYVSRIRDGPSRIAARRQRHRLFADERLPSMSDGSACRAGGRQLIPQRNRTRAGAACSGRGQSGRLRRRRIRQHGDVETDEEGARPRTGTERAGSKARQESGWSTTPPLRARRARRTLLPRAVALAHQAVLRASHRTGGA